MPKFTLKSVVEDLAVVPEAYRERYTKRDDGKFYLDEIEIDDGAELRSSLEREREERRKAKEALEKYKDIDPEKAREAQRKLDEIENKKLTDEGEFNRLLEKRQKEWDAEKLRLEGELQKANGEVRTFKLDDKVRAAAIAAGVFEEDIEDVMTITRSRFDLDEKGRIVVKDEEGDATGSTVEKFFGETFRTMRPKFYKPAESGGSGAPPKPGSPSNTGNVRTVSLSDQGALNDNLEKIASGEVTVD